MPWDDRIGRRLKLRDLAILSAVIQWGSMGQAAVRLAMSQPAVSKAIADLERVVGVPLLDRTRKGVTPTVYGRTLLDGSIGAFDELRQAVKRIDFLKDPTAGELRIGTTEMMAAGLLSAIVERLSRRYPRIVFHVTEADPGTLRYHELRARNVELVIGRVPAPIADDDMEAEVLFHERLFVVAGARNRWARRRKIALADLLDEPWVLAPPETSAGSFVADAFAAAGLAPPRAAVVTYSMHLRNNLAAGGHYLTVLPNSVLRISAHRLSLRVLPVELRSQPRPVVIVRLKNRTLSPVAELFIENARAMAAQVGEERRAL
jgi:DNA-binding transcriptional LysR family regulator